MDLFRYLSVFVLDEDPLACVLAQEALKLIGFEDVYTACHSAAGTAILQHRPPAIVVVNIDEDRRPFWSALAHKRHGGTLVVATSLDHSAGIRIDGTDRDADAFLPKPYSKTLLLRTMTQLLSGNAARRCKIVMFRGDHQRAS